MSLHNCKESLIAFKKYVLYNVRTNLTGTHTPRWKIYKQEVNPMLFAPKEKGQGLVEYALILVLVAVVVIVILSLLGPAIGNIFSNIVGNI
jgi:pilus assembly protein Flp/PilA